MEKETDTLKLKEDKWKLSSHQINLKSMGVLFTAGLKKAKMQAAPVRQWF